jgi:hypothetical protein
MTEAKNPWDIRGWHAIRREAALVRHLVGSGVTALGRASYGDKFGEYYTAFFGLSVGLERLSKLALVADHAISHNGRMPEEGVVSRFGHKLIDLMDAVDAVAQEHKLTLEYTRPPATISVKIIECLDAFADARRGRYANFAALGNPKVGQEEPIRKWWGDVAELILQEHYFGKPAQERAEAAAKVVDAMLSPAGVLYFNETGGAMQDVLSSSIRTQQTAIVQEYGRYYALTVVRWLAEVFSQMSDLTSFNAFYGMPEFFHTYTVSDKLLRARKVWP